MKDFLLKSIFILSLLCSFTSLSAQIFVNTTAPTGGDGVSWATAYRDLQPALSASQNGDEIWVAKGDYYIIGSSETSFEIPSGVKVYGGFLGNETQREQRNWGIHETNLDGASFNNTIVYFEDSNINTVLDGFTIKNGFADGASTREQSGAAIFIDITATTSSPKIANCLINDNNADSNGGAVYIDGSNSGTAAPTFENCTFENNFTLKDGGAVYSSGYSGGSCNPTFEKCSFLNNTSTVGGGALFFHGGDGNATATIKKCDFDSNIAEGNGGAIYSKGTSSGQANHIIINSIFYANQGFAAGALYNNGGDGGDCSPIITNCTFYLNEATGNGGTGGAIYNNGDNSGNSSPEISNCIIYGNIGPFDSQVFRNIDGTPTISYSLVDVADCDELNSGEGSNVTCGDGMKYNMPPLYHDPGAGNLRLLVNSPAIDFGNDSVNNETEDLDCNMRKVNNIDMGAYELPDGNLPIELADFSAYLDEDKVALFWITLSEENNAGFTIERSADGRDFEAISYIPGAGNTTTARTYKSFDYHPLSGTNYYRLKNTSYSGEIDYSPIRIVEMPLNKVNVYPNPVADHLTLTFSDFKEDEALFTIYNIYGKQVYTGSSPVENDVSFISIPEIGTLVPGSYIIKLYSARNGSFSQRFQKIRK